MVRREYLTYVYDETSNDMYLKITPKGDMTLYTYLRKHDYSRKRKKPTLKKEIVKIVK